MARRQVLVQLDDDLVAALDQIAQSEGVSRSALLRRGAIGVIRAAAEQLADRHLADSYAAEPQDELLVESARRLASKTVPPW